MGPQLAVSAGASHFRRLDVTLGHVTSRRIRVDAAAALLSSTDLPISQVAADVGFADQSHLTRCFSRYLGTTPGRYRAEQSRKVASEPRSS